MTLDVAQVETRCPHEGCRWTFVGTALRGKAAVPQHLAIAHGGRHPGEPAAGRAALDAMDAGDPQTPEVGHVEPEVAVKRERPPSKWTRESIVAAIRVFADEHGRTPTQRDAGNAGLVIAGKREFGSWGDAVEAAGFERPRRGHTNRVDAGVAQPERAPADQADDAGSKPAPRFEVPAGRQQDAGTEPAAPPEREPQGQEPPDDDASAPSRPPDDRPDPRDTAVSAVEVASRSDDAADEPGGGTRPRHPDQRRRRQLDHSLRPGSGAVHRGGGEARPAREGVRDVRRRPADLAGDERVTDRGEPVFAALATVQDLMHASRAKARSGRDGADGVPGRVRAADGVVALLGRRRRLVGGAASGGQFPRHLPTREELLAGLLHRCDPLGLDVRASHEGEELVGGLVAVDVVGEAVVGAVGAGHVRLRVCRGLHVSSYIDTAGVCQGNWTSNIAGWGL